MDSLQLHEQEVGESNSGSSVVVMKKSAGQKKTWPEVLARSKLSICLGGEDKGQWRSHKHNIVAGNWERYCDKE